MHEKNEEKEMNNQKINEYDLHETKEEKEIA